MAVSEFEYGYYCNRFMQLIRSLKEELEDEKKVVAKKGTDAVFKYAAEYVEKCDIISSLEDLYASTTPDIEPEIPLENIEFLLIETPHTALSEISEHFGWNYDEDNWANVQSEIVWAIEEMFQDAGKKHG